MSIKVTERFCLKAVCCMQEKHELLMHSDMKEVDINSLNYQHREKVKRCEVMYMVILSEEGESETV